MFELLFDIWSDTGRVRVTTRLACMMSRKGCGVYYTSSSDSVFTSGLLKKGIGRVIYPDDLHWFTPDLVLLDLLLQKRAAVYKLHRIDYLFITTQEEARGSIDGVALLYLPPSPCKPLSQGAREADFIEKLEDIKEGRSQPIIIGLPEKEGSSSDDVEQLYKAAKMYCIGHPEHQFIVLTNHGTVEEKLFALPDNMAVYRPQDLQQLLPLCHLALTIEDRNIRTECTFAHVPALEFSTRDIRKMTPRKLGRHIKDMLNNRDCLIEQQKRLCDFYEQENRCLNELADRLMQQMRRKKDGENEKISIL